MTIEKMRYRISILEETATTDESGFTTKAWNERKKTWASAKKYELVKQDTGEKMQDSASIVFTIRFQVINSENRISFGGKTYTIDTITDVDFANRFLEVSCKEVK